MEIFNGNTSNSVKEDTEKEYLFEHKKKEKTSVFLSLLEKNSTIMTHFCHSSTTVNYSKVLYSFKYSHQVLKCSRYYLLPCKSCVTVRKAVYVAELCKAAISLK